MIIMVMVISPCLPYASVHVCACSVAQLGPTICDPMDCSLSDSSVHGIFQARILEWVSISYSSRCVQGFAFYFPYNFIYFKHSMMSHCIRK